MARRYTELNALEKKGLKSMLERNGWKPCKLSEEDGCVVLMAVDRLGNRLKQGNIVTVSPGGLYLNENVTRETNLPLDEKGRVKLTLG